jgi:hypothetical protein
MPVPLIWTDVRFGKCPLFGAAVPSKRVIQSVRKRRARAFPHTNSVASHTLIGPEPHWNEPSNCASRAIESRVRDRAVPGRTPVAH